MTSGAFIKFVPSHSCVLFDTPPQPGIGGFQFVLMQGLSWAFVSMSLAVFLIHLFNAPLISFFGDADILVAPPSIVSAGIAGLLGQLTMTASLFVYKKGDSIYTEQEVSSDSMLFLTIPYFISSIRKSQHCSALLVSFS